MTPKSNIMITRQKFHSAIDIKNKTRDHTMEPSINLSGEHCQSSGEHNISSVGDRRTNGL